MINLSAIVNKIKHRGFTELIDDINENHSCKKRLVYTSFDGDFMLHLDDMLKFVLSKKYIPINPESSLGYYISTTTHQGDKVKVMNDCIGLELLSDEMWIFNPINGHVPEGVLAELMVWGNNKEENIKIIEFFDIDNFKVCNVDISKENSKCLYMNKEMINEYISKSDIKAVEEIKEKLIKPAKYYNLKPNYIVANCLNYKHIDWARTFCYKNDLLPISPMNILPYYAYCREYENPVLEHIIDRLTLLDKASTMKLFLNEDKFEEEINRLDVFSITELIFWYIKHGNQGFEVINWAKAEVPKYKDPNKWTLTKKEQYEVINEY